MPEDRPAGGMASLASVRKGLPLPVRTGYGSLKRRLFPNPLWSHREFKRYYSWLNETQWWSRSELEALQLEQLKALIKHAYENVPYYRRVFDELRFKPGDIASLDDLQKIPLLTKEDVRNNQEELVAVNVHKRLLKLNSTGGTTGRPLGVYQDAENSYPREAAFRYRQWGWAGYRFADPLMTLRADPIARLEADGTRSWWDYKADDNELTLSSAMMTEAQLSGYVQIIRQFRPKFIQAFPSSLEILAKFIQRKELGSINVSAVFCESEALYPWQREMIQSVFGGEIFLGYGHTERAVDATECERHQGYHVSMEYGILEILGGDGEPITDPGATGMVVGTGFDTYCMPLIRYATDDLALYTDAECTCGRHSAVVSDFTGRVQEFVVAKSGRLLPFTSTFASHAPFWSQVREIKFVQDREGELIVNAALAPSASPVEMERQIRQELFRRLDEDELSLTICFVDQVARSHRGKIGLLEQHLPIQYRDVLEGMANARRT